MIIQVIKHNHVLVKQNYLLKQVVPQGIPLGIYLHDGMIDLKYIHIH